MLLISSVEGATKYEVAWHELSVTLHYGQLMDHVSSPTTLTCDDSLLMEEFSKWLEKVSSRMPSGIILVIDSMDRFQVQSMVVGSFYQPGCQSFNHSVNQPVSDRTASTFLTLWYFDFLAFWLYGILTLWHFDFMAFWLCDILALWHLNFVALWFYDIMTLTFWLYNFWL